MNQDTIQGDWTRLKGKLRQKWAKLTDDDFKLIEGKRQELAGILQKRYGILRDAAEKQAKDFYDTCGCNS